MSGQSANTIFNLPYSFAYDDLIFLPDYINFNTDEIKLDSKLTRNISLKVPLNAPIYFQERVDSECHKK
mgnify:CR=1 FL=1